MFSNSLRVAAILLLAGAAAALAQVSVIPILVAPTTGPSGKVLVVAGGANHLLLVNNTNHVCRAGGC
jgi:hypothetical protein